MTPRRNSFSVSHFIDYLNNLSPDSKEYEDTQGTEHKLPVTPDTLSGVCLLSALIWHRELATREPI